MIYVCEIGGGPPIVVYPHCMGRFVRKVGGWYAIVVYVFELVELPIVVYMSWMRGWNINSHTVVINV